MQLQKRATDHLSLNDGEAVKFNIADDFISHAISMLTKQYSDPEMAFIRETCSNAYDAHTVAGTQDVPFDLHIPSTLSPYIEIRDYGTGISKDFMLNRYVSVGDSTKRKSNSEIGGFGIGRLSFLIVTEQAAITSFFEGMQYSFNIRYDGNSELVMSQTDERPTEEPNGLRLKFPVQLNRIEAFRQAAKNYFKRVTSVLPNFAGGDFPIEKTKYSHTGESGWGIREEGIDNTIFAIMGNIAYPIPANVLRFDDRFKDVVAVLGSRIDLFFDIGEVVPLPTRENLEMCEHTMVALLARLTSMKDELMEKIEHDIAQSRNLWQAKRAYNSLIGAMSYTLRSIVHSLDLEYDGQNLRNLSWAFKSPEGADKLTFFKRNASGYNSSGNTSWARAADELSHVSHEKYIKHVFILNDTPKGVRPTIDYNYPRSDTEMVLITGTAAGWEAFKKQEIAKGLGKNSFKLASNLLPKPKKARTLSGEAMVSVLDPTSGMTTRGSCHNRRYKDFANEKAYYVLASNFQLHEADREILSNLKAYIANGLLEALPILVLNKNRIGLLKEEPNWIHFSKYVKVKDSAIADKRRQVYEACYKALAYGKMYIMYAHNFSKSQLHSQKYWSHKGKSDWSGKPNWKSKLIRETPRTASALTDLEFLLDKYGKHLTSLKDDTLLSPLAKAVGTVYQTDDIMRKVKSLCRAFDIDYIKLLEAARTPKVAQVKMQEMLDSQVYFIMSAMANQPKFDMEKLKKELS